MCCIQARQESSNIRVIEVVLGMCNLEPINMLQPIYLPAKHSFVRITVLERSYKTSIDFIELPVSFHMPLLMVLDIFHALFNYFSETFEIDIEVSLQWRGNFLDHF